MVEDLDYPPGLHARALTIYGSSRRAIGDLEGADEAYRRALTIYNSLLPHTDGQEVVLDKGDLHRRVAYLRAKEGRYTEALQEADRALEIYLAAKTRHECGRTLLARGYVLICRDDSRAIGATSRALCFIDPEESWEDCLAASYILIYALTLFEDLSHKALEQALLSVTEARLTVRSFQRTPETRYLKGRRRKTPADALLRFLQGRILVLLERYEEARELLHTAREDLLELGMARELAAASLELAECYFYLSGIHRWHRIDSLCREVLTLLSTEPDTVDAIAALKLLQRSLLERSVRKVREGLSSARRALGATNQESA